MPRERTTSEPSTALGLSAQDLATLQGGILEFFALHSLLFSQVDKERNTGDGDKTRTDSSKAGAQTEEIKGGGKGFCCYLRHILTNLYMLFIILFVFT